MGIGQTSTASITLTHSSACRPCLPPTATSQPLRPSQAEAVIAAQPHQVVITSPALNLTVGAQGQFTVQLEDAFGNLTEPSSPVIIALDTTSPSGVFYAAPGSTLPIGSIVIGPGTSTASAIRRHQGRHANLDGNRRRTHHRRTDAGGDFQRGAASPIDNHQLATHPAVRNSGTSHTGARRHVRQSGRADERADRRSDSTSADGTFYASAGSTTPITSVVIGTGQTGVSFYYSDTQTGTPTLTALDGALNPVGTTQQETIAGTAATQEVITSAALNLIAGNRAQISVQLQDGSGNASTTGDQETIGLSSTSSSGVFYASPTSILPITSVVINANQSSASVYYEDTRAGTPIVTTTDIALGSAPRSRKPSLPRPPPSWRSAARHSTSSRAAGALSPCSSPTRTAIRA